MLVAGFATAATACRESSAHQATEHVFEPNPECEDCSDIRRRAGAQRAGDLDGGAGFTAFCERDGVGPGFVSASLPRCTFGAIESGGSGAFSGLLPELRFSDANPSDQLHQLQCELVGDELVMGKLTGGRWRERHALSRADGVTAPRRAEP